MNNVSKMDVLTSINHNNDKKDILKELEANLEIGKHLQAIKSESIQLVEMNRQLRPLYGERIDVLERMSYIDSEIEMDVMLEYPPRKGSEAQRGAFRTERRLENEDYQRLQGELTSIDEQIEDLRFRMDIVERDAKNSRRVVEMHTSYLKLISKY